MGPLFPSMASDASSDDWHGFLNSMSGLDVDLLEENSSAFDKWRIALAAQGYDTWNSTTAEIAKIKARGDQLMAAEQKRIAAQPALQAALAAAAPSVTAQQILKKAAQ